MDIAIRQYIRKPLVVEAVQVTPENFTAAALWCHGKITNNQEDDPNEAITPKSQHIVIRVHNPQKVRQTKAYCGDWILYTDKGYKIYTPKAFEASFTELKEGLAAA